MTCFATGSSPNSLVSHIIKSPFVGFYSSPVSPLATLSFLNQQSMCHGHSMHNRSLIHQPKLFTVQGGRRLLSTAFFLPSIWEARIPSSNTCPPFKNQFKHAYLFSRIIHDSLCLPTPRAPHSLLCAASEPGIPTI